MIPFTNSTVTTYRLTTTSGESLYLANLIARKCYIQPKQQSVTNSFDSQGAFKEFVIMMDYHPDVVIGDKFVDQDNIAYYIDGIGRFNDLTGKRTEMMAKRIYD